MEYYECACHSDEHRLVFTYEPGDKEVYASTFLSNYHGIFGRIKNAIKYIFGYKCKYGHFDCFILHENDLDKMINMLNKYKDNMKSGEDRGEGETK